MTARTEEPEPVPGGMSSDAATRIYEPDAEPRRGAGRWLAAVAVAAAGVGAVVWAQRDPAVVTTVPPAEPPSRVEAIEDAEPAGEPEPLAVEPAPAIVEAPATTLAEPPTEQPAAPAKKRTSGRKAKRKKKRRGTKNMDELFPVPP